MTIVVDVVRWQELVIPILHFYAVRNGVFGRVSFVPLEDVQPPIFALVAGWFCPGRALFLVWWSTSFFPSSAPSASVPRTFWHVFFGSMQLPVYPAFWFK